MIMMFVMLAGMVSAGANDNKNDTADTKVNVTSAQPTIVEGPILDDKRDSSINDQETIDLEPNTTTKVHCDAIVRDGDGWNDLETAQAVIRANTTSYPDTQNTTDYYTNSSCTISQDATNNASINCTVDMQYYAEPSEWYCNLTVNDSYGLEVNGSDNATVNELVAMDINRSALNYGDMDVGANKTLETPVQNQGNVGLDGGVDAWEVNGSLNSNLAMNCSYNNVPIDYMRSGLSGTTSYSNMDMLNASGYVNYSSFNLAPVRTDGATTPTWDFFNVGLMIPENVGGICEGVVSVQVSVDN